MKTRPAITTFTCMLAVKDGGHGVSIRRCCEHAVEAVQLPPLSSWTRPEDRQTESEAP